MGQGIHYTYSHMRHFDGWPWNSRSRDCCTWPWMILRSSVKPTHLGVVWMNYLTHSTLETKPWKFVATVCVVAEIFQVACTIMWPWISRSSVKVTYMRVGGMNSLTHKTLETKNNPQDSMLGSRYTPNDDIGHAFDAKMTSRRHK